MPFYAGTAETNITPPIGVALPTASGTERISRRVEDELFARALVLTNGVTTIVLVIADLYSLPGDMAQAVRAGIAARLDVPTVNVWLHTTGTGCSPWLGDRVDGKLRDTAYEDVLKRKLVGVAGQAADLLLPAHLTLGEASAQIGVPIMHGSDGATLSTPDYRAESAAMVRTLCIVGADGRLFGLLFHHACAATTMNAATTAISADWPGAAVAHLQARFAKEGEAAGVAESVLVASLQGVGSDILPIRRDSREAVRENGRIIAEAAHTARWNAHGRLDDTLDAGEIVLYLPLQTPPGEKLCASLYHLQIGGITLLGVGGHLNHSWQLYAKTLTTAPVLFLSNVNGTRRPEGKLPERWSETGIVLAPEGSQKLQREMARLLRRPDEEDT